jgi:hypothetical protein
MFWWHWLATAGGQADHRVLRLEYGTVTAEIGGIYYNALLLTCAKRNVNTNSLTQTKVVPHIYVKEMG